MDWGQLWLGLGLAVPATLIGYLAHRRSKKVDTASAQSGVASNHRAGTQQVIEGFTGLVDQLQQENDKLRSDAAERATRLEALTLEVARLRKLYGANGE